jgi:hypothetical protein
MTELTINASLEEPYLINLNYGVEIEAVFELINVHTAYNQFINFYLNHIRNTYSGNKTINSTIISFIKLLKLCINKSSANSVIRQLIASLITNDIYILLTPEKTEEVKKQEKEKLQEKKQLKQQRKIGKKTAITFLSALGVQDDDESSSSINDEDDDYDYVKIEDFLNKNLNLLIKESRKITHSDVISEEATDFIKKWKEFLNLAITIIKHMYHEFESNEKDVIKTILNVFDDSNNTIFTAFNKIFNLTENEKIKLYKMLNIKNFYTTKPPIDEIFLCLIEDMSVVCTDAIVYKNIKSGQVAKYNYLLNGCEFITQPFNTIDDVKNKLSIFFNNTIIENTLLNCAKTSQHVHISFNNSSGIIRPDIYLILCILCVSLHFQEEIFKLFLITRTDNMYCKKLNYNDTFSNDDIYDLNDITDSNTDYNKCLEKLCNIFSENKSRYYWLNILNLFNYSITKPYTIEFRLKHGSTDEVEIGNVCKLYENIINYANELLTDESIDIKGNKNIKIIKILIEKKIKRGGDDIFKQKILKDIEYYFTNINSDYVKGLNTLNKIISTKKLEEKVNKESEELEESEESDEYGLYIGGIGKLKSTMHNNTNRINNLIRSLTKQPIYKLNSFGYEFIGHGLHRNMKTKLKTTFNSATRIITQEDLKQYLNLHNIYF